MPLNGERACVGVLALRWDANPPVNPSQVHLLETFANQLAVAIERTNLAKDSHESSLAVERERLRSTLLSSVSHDLRTPLAVISSAAEQLRDRLSKRGADDRELAESIANEASRLERQVRDLLDMTRLESGALQLREDWQSLEELVGSALVRTESLLNEHAVIIDLPLDLPLMWLDQVLIEQVLVNLLENSARHTPSGTQVWIKATTLRDSVRLALENDGPNLTQEELTGIFEKFGRGTEASSHGSGLGLAICRAIVEAHGGTIIAQSRLPKGVSFIIVLPKRVDAPEVPLA